MELIELLSRHCRSVLVTILKYADMHQRWPTFVELQDELQGVPIEAIRQTLRQLLEAGWIRHTDDRYEPIDADLNLAFFKGERGDLLEALWRGEN